MLYLPLHVLLNLVQGDMTRAFDEGLHILLPCSYHQFTHCVKFGELSFIIGIGYASRTQSVTQ